MEVRRQLERVASPTRGPCSSFPVSLSHSLFSFLTLELGLESPYSVSFEVAASNLLLGGTWRVTEEGKGPWPGLDAPPFLLPLVETIRTLKVLTFLGNPRVGPAPL